MIVVNVWLAFDIGTTGTKAALVRSDGQIIHSAWQGYGTHSGADGVVEQNASGWLTAVIQTCRELSAHRAFAQVDGIALTGQMQDVILVDSAGEPVRPVILYSDTRARVEAEDITRRVGLKTLLRWTGNEQDAGSLLAKLAWLARHEPESLEAAQGLLFGAADFIGLWMTGSAASDTTTASTTGLMDIRSRAALKSEALKEIGIGACARLLPPLLIGGAQLGALTLDTANTLGLRAGIPVHLGPGDAGANTIGAGSGEPGQVSGYLGTSGWIGFTAAVSASPDSGALTLVHPNPAYFIQIAPLLTAGGNLEWARDLFPSDDYDGIIDRAMSRPPAEVLYLPYLNGERSPFRDPLARGAFIGLTPRIGADDLYRAVLEGVVFAYRHALSALAGANVQSLILNGGGTRSLAWCQLFADITGVTVSVAADAENGGLRGAVVAAQVASGELHDYAPADFFPIAQTLRPDTSLRAIYDRQYRLFLDAYPALRPVFARMGKG
jgi:xylulokinase